MTSFEFNVGDQVEYVYAEGVMTVVHRFESDYGGGPAYVIELANGKSRTSGESGLKAYVEPEFPVGTMLRLIKVGAFVLKRGDTWYYISAEENYHAISIRKEAELRKMVNEGNAVVIYNPTTQLTVGRESILPDPWETEDEPEHDDYDPYEDDGEESVCSFGHRNCDF